MVILFSKLEGQTHPQTDTQMDRRMDGHYQIIYLPASLELRFQWKSLAWI